MSKKKIGECLLTGEFGPYIKSHILPASLTKPEFSGGMLFQHGAGRRAQKRRTSWYDPAMVVASGEKILSDLDDQGIRILRQHRLVWSGFGPATRVEPDILISDFAPDYKDYGLRKVQLSDPELLRRFFMSLLWRASASSLPEMQDVKLSQEDEHRLKSYLTSGFDLPLNFFPISLTQHHDIGFRHNHTPIRRSKKISPFGDDSSPTVPIYRFYFDGLVAHFHDLSSTQVNDSFINALILGHGTELLVSCVPWKRSAQFETLVHVAEESLW